MMCRWIALLLLSLSIVACGGVTGAPEHPRFASASGLGDFEGAFENLGEGSRGGSPDYLSRTLWPDDGALDHEWVLSIEIVSGGPGALSFRAKGTEGVVKEETFVEGRNLELRDGRIVLGKGAMLPLYPPVVGVGYERIELRLGAGGELLRVYDAAFIGFPFPLAFDDVVRFARLSRGTRP